MKIADTHTILWLTEEAAKLSEKARIAIMEARNDGGIAVSSMTLMEIAQLDSKARITLSVPLLDYLRHLEKLCVILPINANISVLAASFSAAYPRDPADRAIGATALHFGLPLITKDEKIWASHEVPCIW